MEDRPLDPKERALKAEGEGMLNAIRQMSGPKSSILGPDGQPIDKKEEQGAKKLAVEAAKKRREELSQKCVELMEMDQDFAECATMLNLCWQTFFWLASELAVHEGVTPDIIEHLNSSFRASVSKKGCNLQEIAGLIKGKMVPYLLEKNRFYADRRRARIAHIKDIESRLGSDHINLPCNSLKQLFKDQKFKPGMALILHGDLESIRLAMKKIAEVNKPENYWLFEEGSSEGKTRCCPEKWWAGCVSDAGKFDEVVACMDNGTVLLFIENITKMHDGIGKEGGMEITERTARSMAKIQSWAFEDMVACVIGLDKDIPAPPPHLIPSCKVLRQQMDGKDHIVIGNDFLEIK